MLLFLPIAVRQLLASRPGACRGWRRAVSNAAIRLFGHVRGSGCCVRYWHRDVRGLELAIVHFPRVGRAYFVSAVRGPWELPLKPTALARRFPELLAAEKRAHEEYAELVRDLWAERPRSGPDEWHRAIVLALGDWDERVSTDPSDRVAGGFVTWDVSRRRRYVYDVRETEIVRRDGLPGQSSDC